MSSVGLLASGQSQDDRATAIPGRSLCLLLALAYGALLASLPLLGLNDRINYLSYPTDAFSSLARNVLAGPLALLANAPLWLLLNGGLGLVFAPENVLRLIIFLQAGAIAYLLIRANPRNWLWLAVFLFFPNLLENFTVHLRQGCGIAVFTAGWLSRGRFSRWTLMGMSPFLHESFAFVVLLYALVEWMKWLRLAEDVRTAVVIVVGLLTGLGLAIAASWVGARQVSDYDVTTISVSGAGFVLWFAVLTLIVLEGGAVTNRYAIAVAGLVLYLSTYFLIAVSGRIFESMIALVLLCGLQLTRWRRMLFLSLIISSGVLGWIIAIANPAASFF